MVALGEPAQVLALLDPDSDLAGALEATGRRGRAAPGLGGPRAGGGVRRDRAGAGRLFRQADFVDTEWGPRLARATTWAGVRLETATEVGWSRLVTCAIEHVEVGEDHDPLGHRRGRFVRLPGPG